MLRKYFLFIMFFYSAFLLTLVQLAAQEEEGEIIVISERVGKEIDPEENNRFKLFEGIKGFQSAVYIKLPDGRYFLKITYRDEKTGEIKISRVLQSEASIKNRGDYIDRFEELQAEKQQYQNLVTPPTVISDSGKIHAHRDTTYQEPGTAFYLELGGKFIGSINVDFPIKKSNRVSVGFLLVCPCFMYFYLPGDKNSRFELGCGFTYIWLGPPEEKRKTGMLFHGVIGYRYQKKNGLLFRAGFTPMLGKGEFVPWLGISFGYSL